MHQKFKKNNNNQHLMITKRLQINEISNYELFLNFTDNCTEGEPVSDNTEVCKHRPSASI